MRVLGQSKKKKTLASYTLNLLVFIKSTVYTNFRLKAPYMGLTSDLIATLTLSIGTKILCVTHLLIMLYLSVKFYQICFSSNKSNMNLGTI